ncbi:MAG: hypothetical protein B6226_00985 [Candidatus Cloacimonetes bacterium 4572_65]|nr:MAG: hypothetical protein B6226_00985 [Candidatus Cloacimonetes bacterium 4572_65]
MKKIIISLVAILLSLNLFAGRYAGDFLSIGGGVRAIAMGGAYSAVADDCNAIYWNTSGIGQIKESKVFAMHAYLYEGLASYDNVAFCQPLPNDATIGINWVRLTVDDIPSFDESYLVGTNVDQRVSNPSLHLPGIPDSRFKSTDDMVQLGFSKHIHFDIDFGWKFFKMPFDVFAGGNVKFIRRKLFDNYGTGTGFDLSFLAVTDLAYVFNNDIFGKVKYGMNFMDLGNTDINWDVTSDRVDEILMNTKLGASIEQPLNFINSNLVVSMDKDYVYGEQVRMGAELTYDKRMAVRCGYHDENYSAGLGVTIYSFEIDYAFVTNTLGSTNRIGLNFAF